MSAKKALKSKEKKKHPGGRPLKYETSEELQTAIDKYFHDAIHDENGDVRKHIKPLTIVGLALALGFESRQSILDYKARDEFSCTINKARMRIEQYLEEKLSGQAVAGVIFNLKNNFDWKDVQKHEITNLSDLGARLTKAHKRKT